MSFITNLILYSSKHFPYDGIYKTMLLVLLDLYEGWLWIDGFG